MESIKERTAFISMATKGDIPGAMPSSACVTYF